MTTPAHPGPLRFLAPSCRNAGVELFETILSRLVWASRACKDCPTPPHAAPDPHLPPPSRRPGFSTLAFSGARPVSSWRRVQPALQHLHSSSISASGALVPGLASLAARHPRRIQPRISLRLPRASVRLPRQLLFSAASGSIGCAVGCARTVFISTCEHFHPPKSNVTPSPLSARSPIRILTPLDESLASHRISFSPASRRPSPPLLATALSRAPLSRRPASLQAGKLRDSTCLAVGVPASRPAPRPAPQPAFQGPAEWDGQ